MSLVGPGGGLVGPGGDPVGPATGGDVLLAGSSAGSSSANGVVTATVALAATATGTSTVASRLTADLVLAGGSDGSSTVTSDLTVDGPVTYSSRALVGPAGGRVGPAGGLVGAEDLGGGDDVFLTGVSAGTSSVISNLTADRFLETSAAGTSTVTSHLTATVVLSGSSAGSSTALGQMPLELVYTSVLGTLDTLLGWVVYNQPAPEAEAGELYGRAEGNSAATAHLTATDLLKATSNGLSSVVGHVSGATFLQGSSAASSTAIGVLFQENRIAGSTSGVSSATSVLRATRRLQATSAGLSVVAPVDIDLPIRLPATSAGVSSVTSVLSRNRNLHGISGGLSTSRGFLGSSGPRYLTTSPVIGRAQVHGSLTGGTVSSGLQVISPQTGSVTTAPSAAGSNTITVADGSVFHVGQTIVVNGIEYVVTNVAGNVLTLDTPLVTPVGTGSVVVGLASLQVDTGPYAVHHPTLADLEAMSAADAVMVQMQAREPAYVRAQPAPREISLTVMFLARTYAQRRSDYEDFVASLDSLSGTATLRWVGSDGVTREYEVVALSVSPDAWFYRATAQLVAANPEPVVVGA